MTKSLALSMNTLTPYWRTRVRKFYRTFRISIPRARAKECSECFALGLELMQEYGELFKNGM